MPAKKSELHIAITYRGVSFSISGREITPGLFELKRGRSKSKAGLISNTSIMALCRSWLADRSRLFHLGVWPV